MDNIETSKKCHAKIIINTHHHKYFSMNQKAISLGTLGRKKKSM